MKFGWDDRKARANLRKHDISFELATKAFEDDHAIEELDDREDYGEERQSLLGLADGVLVFVIFTIRGDRVRIISARKATSSEEISYYQNDAF